MHCRRLILFLGFALPVFAAELPAPAGLPPAAPKDSGKNQWVFSILPKSLQKNPLLDLTVITEMTDAGRQAAPVTPEHPGYFELFSAGFRQLGDVPANEKTLAKEDVAKLLTRALATNGYHPAKAPEQPPSVLIIYTWGSHNRRDEADAENPSLSAQAVAANILDRAALVGGERFAQKLLELFEQADSMQIAASARVPPGGEQVITPEMVEFANPVAMFRRASGKNESLLDQTTNDVYYVVASAYDYRSATSNRKILLWRTRMTVAAQGVSQEQTLPTLMLSAGPYFGRDMPEAELLTKRPVPNGTVEIGTPVVVPSAEAPKPKK
jgi:hypothetical protein